MREKGGFRPVDEPARERARADHETSLILEAGAGTGKTTLLVDRIEALIRTGHASLGEVAAVTFTENAATTMKLRLREGLEKARLERGLKDAERSRVEAALESLERAQISTIHALCAAILHERPIECGVTPGFRVADEAEADLLFADAWLEWLSGELSGGETVVLEALQREIPLESDFGRGERQSLRGLARALIEERDLEPIVETEAPDPVAFRAELRLKVEKARALVKQAKPGDALASRLQILVSFAEAAEGLEGDALPPHLDRLEAIPKNYGFKPHWSTPEALSEARAIAQWTGEAQRAWRVQGEAALHGRLITAVRRVGTIYERKKTEEGLLDFLDLLIKTRDALRDRPSVRAAVQKRFSRLIIDEFQDTDPLQVEIARLVAGDRPGALVVVGDPKQSIYRFRRADVSLFRDLSEEAQKRPGWAVLHLTQNFRSRSGILRFVNRTFSRLIQASAEAGQPPYEPLDAPPGLDEGPAVRALRFSAPFPGTEDILRAEAATLAPYLERLAEGGCDVRDMGTERLRPSRAGDVMILVRRLTQIRFLEEALEEAGLRFTVEGGKSFFDRLEVREALALLRAIDDPSDRISLVAALRSSFLGVSDRDIATYALGGGPLWLRRVDETKPGAEALGPALELLATLHARRTRWSVPFLLETLYDETRILPALAGTRKGEAQIANLEKIVTLARQASDLGILTLRGFVRFLQERIESAREEPDLPSSRPGDPHTLRILSIHKAKGLEAPIVALFDSADTFWPSVESVPFWKEGKIALGFRKACQPRGWDLWVAKEKVKEEAESRRLLYVATTRARDLLILPLVLGSQGGGFWSPLTDPPLSDIDARDGEEWIAPLPGDPAPDLKPLAMASGGDPVAERWDSERALMIEAATRRPFVPVAAVKAAARSAPAPVLAIGRPGARDFGTLVHRTLELIDLDRPEDAPALALSLAPSLGLDAAAAEQAATLAQQTLALPLLDRARKAARCFRELPLVFPDGEDLVEGVMDLVFEDAGGFVVVDYKTDSITEAQALDQAAHHAPQLQVYGRGLALATGLSVRERLVLFVSIGRAVPV